MDETGAELAEGGAVGWHGDLARVWGGAQWHPAIIDPYALTPQLACLPSEVARARGWRIADEPAGHKE